MNNPHTDYLLGDRQDDDMKTTTVDSDFGEILDAAYRVWKDGSLSDPDKGNEIRRLALVALANRDEDDEDETSIHTDGPAEPHTQAGTLESYIDRDGFIRLADGRLLDVRPREMSRQELRRAKERLTGGYDVLENRRESEEDRDIQAAIDRRDLHSRLLSHPSNF